MELRTWGTVAHFEPMNLGNYCVANTNYPPCHDIISHDKVFRLLKRISTIAHQVPFKWTKLHQPKHGECFIVFQASNQWGFDGYTWIDEGAHSIAQFQEGSLDVFFQQRGCRVGESHVTMTRSRYRLNLPSNSIYFVHYLYYKSSIGIPVSHGRPIPQRPVPVPQHQIQQPKQVKEESPILDMEFSLKSNTENSVERFKRFHNYIAEILYPRMPDTTMNSSVDVPSIQHQTEQIENEIKIMENDFFKKMADMQSSSQAWREKLRTHD